ncbi:hypothetical protein F5Y19DRAFT_436310 [Xylariaceae sp. FL1651]|nr:hypothetical protein F5Y19DRAFT_436310 [Xylariaceae sp. FL1651]
MGLLTDPAKDSRYLALTYLAPRQSAHYNLRPLAQNRGHQMLPPSSYKMASEGQGGGLQASHRPATRQREVVSTMAFWSFPISSISSLKCLSVGRTKHEKTVNSFRLS